MIKVDIDVCLKYINSGPLPLIYIQIGALTLILEVTAIYGNIDILEVLLVVVTAYRHLTRLWTQELADVEEVVLEASQVLLSEDVVAVLLEDQVIARYHLD